MKIAKNAVVVLRYEVEVEGQIVDRMTEERPLDYIHGTNMLLPRFEQEIEGREEGYEFAFSASPEEGYGEYDPANVVEIPKTAFMVDGKLHDEILVKGRFIPMFNGAGEVVHGQVMEVKEEVVVMDFNHPMAGKTLNFSGKVLQVREATEKELQEGAMVALISENAIDDLFQGDPDKALGQYVTVCVDKKYYNFIIEGVFKEKDDPSMNMYNMDFFIEYSFKRIMIHLS